MKILLFGGSGTLGKELLALNSEIIVPTRRQMDISGTFDELSAYVKQVNPDIIINAAAEIDNRSVDRDANPAIFANIVGAANVSSICINNGIRLIYISTDYIYKGDRGNYKETDEIFPFNLYSWTKLGGECSAKCVKNHLIIRTSFGKNVFDYNEAFNDKWTSKDYVDIIAPMIYEAAISPLVGVLNVGTERKTVYDYASNRNSAVEAVRTANTSYFTPQDTSLNLQKWIDYKSSGSMAKPHHKCRVCGSTNLTKYLDLGIMPLANNLEFTSERAKNKDRFPLQVLFCNDCNLSQLSVVIDPSKMFSYYTYRSSVNLGYVSHCKNMAKDLKSRFDLTDKSFIVDIAGNDGTLLKAFMSELNSNNVLNIDPATNLTAIAEADGVRSINSFWSLKLAIDLRHKLGEADLITATNVFAHVDNVVDFIRASHEMLKIGGVLILEFPYLIDFIEKYEFDTVYFEHLSYFSIIPLVELCNNTGMEVLSVERQNIHGGTVRVCISRKESMLAVDSSVYDFCKMEIVGGYNSISKYRDWADVIKSNITNFSSKLLELKKRGCSISAFAASAKGNTLLCSSGINTDIVDYIADETPEKIGKYSPITGIPIVNKSEIIKNPTDYIIILSWNFKDEIIDKLNKIYKGKYIIPIPNFEIVDSNG